MIQKKAFSLPTTSFLKIQSCAAVSPPQYCAHQISGAHLMSKWKQTLNKDTTFHLERFNSLLQPTSLASIIYVLNHNEVESKNQSGMR